MPSTTELRLEAFMIRALTATNVVLQYDRDTVQLCGWPWWVIDCAIYVHSSSPGYAVARPIEDKERVRPCMLRDHKVTHDMPGPKCFCSLKDRNLPADVEAAIYLVPEGMYRGQYVVSCAKDTCGYFGESSLRSDWNVNILIDHC
jgi:hypothetical protein